MAEMTAKQQSVLNRAVDELAAVPGIRAVVLGGSFARGVARADSDIDVGIYYRESEPFSIDHLTEIARELHDSSDPVVSGFHEWGPWVNGGAWLTVEGQRVDFLYRSLDQWDRVQQEASSGRYELHFGQQPPFGFFSPTYLGEMRIAVAMVDESSDVASRKRLVDEFPDALRRSIVQNCLWGVEFGLGAFAPKFAAANDTLGVAGCLTRFAYFLVLSMFALNRQYLVNDKTALAEIAGFEQVPDDFVGRVSRLLANAGSTTPELQASLEQMRLLHQDVVQLAGEGYRSNRSPGR